jgi:ribosome-associated toxin RatA of RatAB toxin-antitoxin module
MTRWLKWFPLVLHLLTPPASAREPDACRGATHPCAVREDVEIGGLHGVQLEIEVPASVARVWQLLGDCARWPQYFAHVKDCRTLDGEVYQVRIELSGLRYDVACEPTGTPGERLRFSRVGGDMRRLEGEWRLRSMGAERTLVTYTIAADVGWYAPASAVRTRLLRVLADIAGGLTKWTL